MKRVAILQNQFRLSGRTRVMCEVIKLLNDLDIEPDVLTFTPAEIARPIGKYFGLDDLRFNVVLPAKIPLVRGYFVQVLMFNLLTRGRQGSYDLVINSNDTLYGLNSKANYLHYIHYPTPAAGHVYRYETSLPRRIYGGIMVWLLRHSGGPVRGGRIYTNGQYSREAIHAAFDVPQSEINIIYPPSYDDNLVTEATRVQRCVSAGSILPEKNQLQQLEIARQLPELEFWIMGAIGSPRYYAACQEYIAQHNLKNVHLKPNMPFKELQAALDSALIFIHSMKNEPFGISTVQALAAGCLPVVHDAAGQREIVTEPQYRYESTEDAVAIIRRVLAMSAEEQAALRQQFQAHIGQFSRAHFREQMQAAVQAALEASA